MLDLEQRHWGPALEGHLSKASMITEVLGQSQTNLVGGWMCGCMY